MAGFGKYDSEFSALKALAYAMGCTTPEGGWDSSYSIMSTMYEHLVGSAPVEGVSLMSMVDEIQTGVESGEIAVSYDCVNEIERLNEVVRGMENAVNNAESIKQQALDELRAEKDAIINDLQTQLDEGGVLDPALVSIGYTRSIIPDYYNHILNGCEYAKKIQDEWDINETHLHSKYAYDEQLVFFPMVDMSKVTDCGDLFVGCSNLEITPSLDLSSCTNQAALFYNCKNLKHVGDITFKPDGAWELGNLPNANNLFGGCISLTKIPKMYNTKNLYTISNMLYECRALKQVDAFDISGLKDEWGMVGLFNMCTSLEEVGDFVLPPTLKTLNATFQQCERLKKFPNWNTENITSFEFCFGSAGTYNMWEGNAMDISTFKWNTSSGENFMRMFAYSGIPSGPIMNTSKAIMVEGMFEGCSVLTSLPEYDFSSLTNPPSLFGWSANENITDLGGFKNLKVGWSYGLVDMCPNLTVDSLMNVINKLGDVTDNPQTAIFGSNIEKLTPEQIQIATNKGWTISN